MTVVRWGLLAVVLLCGCTIFRDTDGVSLHDAGSPDTAVPAYDMATDDSGTDVGDASDAAADLGPCPEVDLQSDPDNCGVCARECFASCDAGICDAIVVARDQSAAFGIAVDDGFVYWSNEDPGEIWRAPKDGGSAELLAQSVGNAIPFNPRFLHLTATDVVVSVENAGSVGFGLPLFRVSKSGGQATGFAGSIADGVEDFAIAGDRLYLAQRTVDTLLEAYFVETPTIELPGNVPAPVTVAVDGTTLYWAGEGGIGTLPTTGGTATPIAAATVTSANQLVLDGGRLFVTTGSEVLSVDPMTQAVDVLATSLFGAFGLAVDTTHVYFAAGGPSGFLLRVPKDGSADAEPLVTGLPTPHLVAVDDTQVFWTNRGTASNGMVLRRSKD